MEVEISDVVVILTTKKKGVR